MFSPAMITAGAVLVISAVLVVLFTLAYSSSRSRRLAVLSGLSGLILGASTIIVLSVLGFVAFDVPSPELLSVLLLVLTVIVAAFGRLRGRSSA